MVGIICRWRLGIRDKVDSRKNIRQHSHIAITIIIMAFVVLGLAASIINPLHEATDELRHYRFVRHIAQRHSLPVQGQGGCSAQAHHPPLFYALGAVATAWIDTGRDVCYEPPINNFWNYRQWEVGRDNKNLYLHGADEAFPWSGEALAAHIIRALNVFIGAGVVWLTWATAGAIWPRRPALALGAAAFVAFNPMFVYMAGAINNDVIATLSATIVVLACVYLVQDENGLSHRRGFILGLLFGLALMSKFNLAALALLIEAAVTWVAWRRRQWRLWLSVNLLIAGVTLLIAGWWFARNQLLYGEPTGFRILTELWGARNPADSWGVAIFELAPTWTSLWGRFGYGQIPLPNTIYEALRWLATFALSGLAVPLFQRRQKELARTGLPLLLLALNVILFFAVVFNYLLVSPAGAMGRFFFPALPSLAILMFYGLSQWLSLLTQSIKTLVTGTKISNPQPSISNLQSSVSNPQSPILNLALLTNLAMATLTIVALFGYLAPAYARPPAFNANAAVPNPVNAHFDTLAILRGYDLSTTVLRPGEPLDIKLYWEVTAPPPGNYLLFVHLIDNENGTMVVQRDTHPGLGNFPSSQWQPGDRFVESIRLVLPETAYTPATATLSVGLYAPDAYRLAITGAGGDSLGDALELGTVNIAPLPGPNEVSSGYPNRLDQNFNNEVRLVGYEYDRRTVPVGESLAVTLYWEALPAVATNYIVEVHLCDELCQPWNVRGTAASLLPGSQSPPSGWKSGQIVRDSHVLPIHEDLSPGSYFIHVALLDAMTKEPHNIIAEDGHWIDNRLLLSRVRIEPTVTGTH